MAHDLRPCAGEQLTADLKGRSDWQKLLHQRHRAVLCRHVQRGNDWIAHTPKMREAAPGVKSNHAWRGGNVPKEIGEKAVRFGVRVWGKMKNPFRVKRKGL